MAPIFTYYCVRVFCICIFSLFYREALNVEFFLNVAITLRLKLLSSDHLVSQASEPIHFLIRFISLTNMLLSQAPQHASDHILKGRLKARDAGKISNFCESVYFQFVKNMSG